MTANRAKQSLLAYMNHELRSPLNSILNLTEVIRSYQLPVKIYSMLDIIKSSVNTQLQFINSILDFSKLEVGQYKLNLQIFDLYSTVHDVIQMLRPQSDKKGIKLHVFIDAKCERYLLGSPDQLKQLLTNLISNAIKFTHKGHVKLSVLVVKMNESTQELVFEIVDTGIGIAAKDQKKIFQPFVQGGTSITEIYGGTGLGLTISDELTKLMGGSLVLESVLGKGSSFIFKCVYQIPEQEHSPSIEIKKLSFYGEHKNNLEVLEYYNNKGMEVSHFGYDQFSAVDVNNNSIIFIDPNTKPNEDKLVKDYISKNNIGVVEVSSRGTRNQSDYCPVTIVNEQSSPKALLNALTICATLRPNADMLSYGLPYVERILDILIAEDNQTLREIHKIMFNLTGHRITLAKDGTEAILALSKDNFDVVILDHNMPGLSGIDVVHRYKIINKEAKEKFILLTADTEIIRSKILCDEFSLILSKPVEPRELLQNVYKLFDPSCSFTTKHTRVSNGYDEDHNHECLDSLSKIQPVFHFIELSENDYPLELLDIYREEMNALLNELVKSELNAEESNINNILHKMQGAALSMGAVDLGKAITDILKYDSNIRVDGNITKSDIESLLKMHDEYLANMANRFIS